ncbi:MAG: tRNA (adenosine(37)-N6)-threonylcarbamoyltransferase complex dimerization subunit type 1 TsaB [Candidatus Eisenbacteria bacterium]
MIALGIDTSDILGGVALARGERLLAEARGDTRAATSERILPQIERLLGDLGLGIGAIERIGVVLGPGSFTGVRVGLATAKGLAMGLGIPVVGISGIEARVHAVGAPGHPVLILVSPRRGEVFCGAGLWDAQGYRSLLAEASRPVDQGPAWVGEAVRAAEALGRLPLVCAGDGAGLLRELEAEPAFTGRILILTGAATAAAPGAAALLAARAEGGRLVQGQGLDDLSPAYLRGAEARAPSVRTSAAG